MVKLIGTYTEYYKINQETGKEECVFILDLIVGIEKWKRVTNDVKEKILLFITEKKDIRIF
ncbi:hypothetical protein [Spiroplasma endosymbiont of Polydrusus formosus]|uniref:hypothetical protein n=1 Tax=Spiroplasma endosymbiont of Polydrusus formosus TaxID=3139326 RepID=UPI0035B56784